MEESAVIPGFLVIGAVKAGTTSLHHYLQQHADIYLSPIKETNYFSRADMDFENFIKAYRYDVQLDLDKYLSKSHLKTRHIAHVNDHKSYRALYRDAPRETITGEVCNSYLICPSTAKEIQRENPNAKIIAVLRNPIERIFSHYLMNVKEGKTLESNFLKEITADLNAPKKGWGVSHQYHELGNYYSQLKPYFDIFPQQQILVLDFQALKVDVQTTLKRIFSFLGVEPDQVIDTGQKLNTAGKPRFGKLNHLLTQTGAIKIAKQIVPQGMRRKMSGLVYTAEGLPTLSESDKNYLNEYYGKEIDQLGKLLNRDFSFWKS